MEQNSFLNLFIIKQKVIFIKGTQIIQKVKLKLQIVLKNGGNILI